MSEPLLYALMASNRVHSKTSPTFFEFTKRKRYAELLISEIADCICIVLNLNLRVLFCGPASYELIGWRDDELVDSRFEDICHDDDKDTVQRMLQQSLHIRDEVIFYSRLRRKQHAGPYSDDDQLFEIAARPYFVPGDQEFKCFILAARPYPSKTTSMLNEFLDLKIQQEYLLHKRQELLSNDLRDSAAPPRSNSSYTTQNSDLNNSSSSAFTSLPYTNGALTTPVSASSDKTHFNYNETSMQFGGYHASNGSDRIASLNIAPRPANDAREPNKVTTTTLADLNGANDASGNANGTTNGVSTSASSAGPKSKKSKKNKPTEQYVCVTCGRTDSPEWRKGPQGPKTLCNACGLRWAKVSRKPDGEDADPSMS